jgi:hypothetical protein
MQQIATSCELQVPETQAFYPGLGLLCSHWDSTTDGMLIISVDYARSGSLGSAVVTNEWMMREAQLK